MLRQLKIANFALIEKLELNWNNGFTVITGETGSGKSILLNALQLILGERADFSVIGPSSNKAIVEAVFDFEEHQRSFFESNDLDIENQLIIRREINKEGKSRAFINDSPVSLQILKTCTSDLVQIHSQYNTLELKSTDYQLSVVDTLADLNSKKQSYFRDYKSWQAQKRALEEKISLRQQQMATADYNRFILDEILTLELDKTDYGILEKQLQRADQADQLKHLFAELSEFGSSNLVDNLYSLRSKLDKLKGEDEQLQNFTERLNSILLEWKEFSNDANQFLYSLENEQVDIHSITDKIDKYNRILSKHRLSNQEELLNLQTELLNSTDSMDALKDEIQRLETQVQEAEKKLLITAESLHNERINATTNIQNNLHTLLQDLKLPHTTIAIAFEKTQELLPTGISKIQFLFSANMGIAPVPIERAASGGELSRFMLALQKLISEKKSLPTVLFDEIDTGVSGDVAQKMGNLLRKMGVSRQLIAISHLPQVVAQATTHFYVAKSVQNERMQTAVSVLNEEERVQEVARLLSGDKITDAALDTAKHLMQA